jgi:peptidoglycan L-alanyl-D-glutamate endopeptidase CwlK
MIDYNAELLQEVAAKVDAWRTSCGTMGVNVLVYCAYRSPETQAELYRHGRDLPPPILTNALPWQSAHQYRRAVDAVPLVLGKCLWKPFRTKADEMRFRATGDLSCLVSEWQVFASEAEAAGLQWAGRWKTRKLLEYVHCQDLGGKTITELRAEMIGATGEGIA